jgi:hypothetical protein
MDELVDKLKKVLEICGDRVDAVQKTADGATAVVHLSGKDHRVFICPIVPPNKIILEQSSELN